MFLTVISLYSLYKLDGYILFDRLPFTLHFELVAN